MVSRMALAQRNVPEGRISSKRCAKDEDPVGTLDDGIAFGEIVYFRRGETYPLCDIPAILHFLVDRLAKEDKVGLYLYFRRFFFSSSFKFWKVPVLISGSSERRKIKDARCSSSCPPHRSLGNAVQQNRRRRRFRQVRPRQDKGTKTSV